MKLDIASIKDSRVRVFYSLYWLQHQILHDFFARLTEPQFDVRMVDRPGRKSDTPRESLAHIMYVQLVFFTAVKTGRLEYRSMGVEHLVHLPKTKLLAEWDRIDQEMFDFLTGASFDSSRTVDAPWAKAMNAIDLLFFLRDHDILHIGWNLAYMDYFDMPRYESLTQYWG